MKSQLHLAVSLAAIAVASPAAAQDRGVVIMRKVMSSAVSAPTPGSAPAPTPSPAPTPAPTPAPSPAKGDWTVGSWQYADADACTDAARQTRTVACEVDGSPVDASRCSGPAPAGVQSVPRYDGCGFQASGWSPYTWSSTCSTTAVRTRTAQCLRSDGTKVDAAQCEDHGVALTEASVVPNYSGCTYAWETGAWSSPSSTCGQSDYTRTVACRSSDGRSVEDSFCGGDRPASTRSDYQIGGCSFSWKADEEWSSPVPACGATVQNRPVVCMRSDGQQTDDASCAPAARPAAQRPATDYSTCTYGWSAGSWDEWSGSCGTATRTRTVTCQSSDGRTVDDGSCDPGTRPETSQSAYQTSGCGYQWQYGEWGTEPACGASRQWRAVWCLRSDGQVVDGQYCGPGQPADNQAATDYSTCSYAWTAGAWTAYSSSCSSSAARTRTVSCQRSDGTAVGDDRCVASDRPAGSETQAVYSSCTYAPTYGAWGDCQFMGTRRRPVSCTRLDGTPVDASFCGAQSDGYQYGTCEAAGEAIGTKTSAAPGEEILRSPSGRYRLVFQTDGDLTILDAGGTVTWHSDTHVANPVWYFQGDGNMVVYRNGGAAGAPDAAWHTDTWANPTDYYVLDDSGQLSIYNQARQPSLLFRTQGGTSTYYSPTRR